jgi:hypothetical protein
VAAIVSNNRKEHIVDQSLVLHHKVHNPLPISGHPDAHDVRESVQRVQKLNIDLSGQQSLPAEIRDAGKLAPPDYLAPGASLSPATVR